MKEIVCPKCKSTDLVLEAPRHGDLKIQSIKFYCFCPSCDLGFVAHCTYSFVKVTDLEDFTESDDGHEVRY